MCCYAAEQNEDNNVTLTRLRKWENYSGEIMNKKNVLGLAPFDAVDYLDHDETIVAQARSASSF